MVTPVAVTGEALLVPFASPKPPPRAKLPSPPAKQTPTSKLSEALLALGWGESAPPAPAVAPAGIDTWLEVATSLSLHQSGVYASLCAAGPPEVSLEEQIEIDIARTQLGDAGELIVNRRREALRRVLHAYTRYDPATGYVQGMDSIAAAALMHDTASTNAAPRPRDSAAALEERAFWWLVHVSGTLLDGFFTQGMPGLWRELSVLRAALVSVRPKLVTKLDALGFDLTLLAPGWYLTLFTRILDDAELEPTLSEIAVCNIEPTHVALGVVLACESELLAAIDFDQAAAALCGTVGASRTRRAPAGVLAHAMKLATVLMPPKKLAQMRADEAAGAADQMVGTPRARQATRRWFESPWSKK